jgi:hypothetical protein
MRTFPMDKATSPQGLQESQNALRTIAEIVRVVPYSSRPMVLVRAQPDEMAVSEWLFAQLLKPAKTPADYHWVGSNKPPSFTSEVRVVDSTGVDVAATLSKLRTSAQIVRAVPLTEWNLIAMRGTADQVNRATAIVAQR